MRMRACTDCTRRSYKIGLRNLKGTVTIAIADRDRSGRSTRVTRRARADIEVEPRRGAKSMI